jgi:predicted DNA-binding helix-hairpin-helix protein
VIKKSARDTAIEEVDDELYREKVNKMKVKIKQKKPFVLWRIWKAIVKEWQKDWYFN